MKMKLSLLALMVALMGCNAETEPAENTTAQETTEQANNQQVEQTNVAQANDLQEKYQQFEEVKKRQQGLKKTRAIHLNGEKYLTSASQLQPGSKVFNVLMKEYGRVKDSIVVVSDVLNEASLKQNYPVSSVVRIAKNTYRLRPQDIAAIYALYQKLSAAKDIQTTELEIDFSGELNESESY